MTRFTKIFWILTAALMLAFPRAVVKGASAALHICAGAVVPSLFPPLVVFSILSSVISVKNKTLQTIWIVLIGQIGGYPAGAKMLKGEMENGRMTGLQVSKLLPFCVNGGIPFIISSIGFVMLKDISFGLIIFMSCVISNLAAGFIVLWIGSGKRKEDEYTRAAAAKFHAEHKQETPNMRGNSVFANSISNSTAAILTICAYIVFFSTAIAVAGEIGVIKLFTALLSQLPLTEEASSALIVSFIEIANGASLVATNSGNKVIPLASFVLSFSSLSIIMQVKSLLGREDVNFTPFYISRIVAAVLSLLVGGALSNFFLKLAPAFSNVGSALPSLRETTPFNIVTMVFLCALFIETIAGNQRSEVRN